MPRKPKVNQLVRDYFLARKHGENPSEEQLAAYCEWRGPIRKITYKRERMKTLKQKWPKCCEKDMSWIPEIKQFHCAKCNRKISNSKELG